MKKIICLITMLGAWAGISAQDVMAQINAIKLQGGHLTAQYSHEVADSAFIIGARDILHQLNMKGYGVFTLDEILPKTGHLDMPRGNTVRVFTYLNMAGISKKDNAARETISIQPKFEVNDNTGAETYTTSHATVQAQPQYTQSPLPQNVDADDLQAQLARDIMAQKDLTAAMNILKAKKSAGLILAFGPFAKGTNIDEVYIAIFDRTTSAPMAVLSPTIGDKRSNLITKADDSLSNYHGCKAIWISF